MKPTRLSAKRTIRFDIPLPPIRFPANVKYGIASSGNESIAVKQYCGISNNGTLLKSAMLTAVAIPMEIPIGTLKVINPPIKRNNNAISTRLPPI
jgi:hypothetical protein